MNSTKRTLIIALWVVAAAFVALTAATYAWMSIATSYEVSDLELNVITENALEIAPDVNGAPGEWVKLLSTEELIGAGGTLRPITWSAKNMAFYAPKYGLDGRIDSVYPYLVTELSETSTPSAEAEEEGVEYLISVDVWMRTGASKVTTYLSGPDVSDADTAGDGTYLIGVPKWNAEALRHDSGGNGAEYAIRIGFLTYDEEYEDGAFYIYEPNTGKDEAPCTSIDGEGSYEGECRLIRQNPSGWTEQTPVLHGSVDYVTGEFIDEDTSMFTLISGSPRRVTIFVWLEGQDAQCVNSISAGELIANLQIAGKVSGYDQEIERPNGGSDDE